MTVRSPRRAVTSLSWQDVALVVAASSIPVLRFLATNAGELVAIGPLMLVGVGSALVALAVLVALLAVRAELDAGATASAVAAVLLWFWTAGWLADRAVAGAPERAVAALLWLLVAGLLALLAYRLGRHRAVRVRFLLAVAVLAAFLGVSALFAWGGRSATVTDGPRDDAPLALERSPDIYFFLLDEYARADSLQAILDVDNSAFLDGLSERGLVVAPDSFSAYAETPPSLASLFATEYVLDDRQPLAGAYAGMADQIVNDTTVVRRLRASGYQFVYAPTGMFGWSTCDAGQVDVCLPPRQLGLATDEQTDALLANTPLVLVLPPGTPVTDPLSVLDELDAAGDAVDRPFFLFAHILSPHPSWRYAEGCEPYDVQRTAFQPRTDSDRVHYVRDLGCLNAQMLEAIDRIQADDPDAIVIVQADHGSKFLTPAENRPVAEWSAEALVERFAILDAMQLPEGCALPEGPRANVNTFRIVFACLEDDDRIEIDNRAYLDTGGDSLEVVPDATERLGAPLG